MKAKTGSNEQNQSGLWNKIIADKRLPLYLLVVTVAAIALIVGILDWSGSLKLKSEVLSPDTYGQLFSNLFIVAVIVERFIEIFNSIYRRQGRLQKDRDLEYAKKSKDDRKIASARKALDEYRNRTETLAMYIGFIVGILIGFAGLRTLALLFEPADLVGSQVTLFWTMDILLTAGLISGGSKGINGITSIIGEFLDQSRQRAANANQGDDQGISRPSGGSKK